MNSEPNLYFDRKLVPNFPALLHLYDRDEFDSPHRSTVPLMALVKDKNTLHKILADCQASMPVDFHFEFKVDHRSEGRGKPSHTDLMVVSDTACIAIESKWTEPTYENIASWLSKGTDNREKVLKGWLALLSPQSMPPSSAEIADCEYQMVHRAASACATASSFVLKKRPMLAYFKFISRDMPLSAASTEYYRTALALLHSRLRLTDFPTFLVEIQMAPTEQFGPIANLPKATPTTGNSVRSALQQTSLFNFLSYKVEQIVT
jgi:hypothetical protein